MINWRYNPFTKVFNPTSLTEYHVVEYMDDCNMYGFQLYEAPQRVATLGLSMTVTQYITGGATWTEVSRNTAPNAGQYRVDYDADTFFGTGRVNFNAADVGKVFSVSYQGLGLIISEQNIARVGSGFFSRMAFYDSPGSATWTVPNGVTKCYVKLIGGGGAGGRFGTGSPLPAGGGGGGGGVAEKLCTVITGQQIALTIGAGGDSTYAVNSGNGGTTSFGGVFSATGGSHGGDQAVSAAAAGGASGIGSGGDLNYGLGDGCSAYPNIALGTGGGPGGYASAIGAAANGNKYGGGGGGGFASTPGNGGSGAIIIWY